jgi:hypothetical protein
MALGDRLSATMVTDLVPSYPLGAIAGVTIVTYNDRVVLWTS